MRLIPRALMVIVFCLLWSAFALLSLPQDTAAEESGDAWVSRLVSVQGQAFVKRAGRSEWQAVRNEETFFPGDAFRVAADSRAAIVLVNESVLRIDQYTTLVFTGIEKEKTFLMELLEGAAFFFSRKARSLKVVTPFVNGVVEGTEFYVKVDADRTTIILYEGAVLAENRQGDLTLAKGQAAVAAKDRAPRLETIVRPRDAVQWSLYYPPVLAVRPDEAARREGDAGFYVNRAATNLSVGRVDEAAKDIGQALALDAGNSSAMALRSVMAVVQNRKADALQDAHAAVEMDGRSTAARIALSYALQAHFDIEAAADAAQMATQLDTENDLAWARLAELRLSLGDTKGALRAANKAAALSPDLAHVQTVLGYAYLTRIKTDEALEAFDQAIALDDAAPLPRLGSGLAKIRDGDLEAGRADIEIAAGLDPDNALIRSYLGKAYFDEKRDPLDKRQFEMAKQLDPNDPTPWFYDAIRKQSINRPGEALHDMQKAIELNDNRAVYRSRLLLDEDEAARNAALGSIYRDLSFQELALNQGWKSLNADPGNYSAHRLLADMYSARPRHEIARVSELLQSQLLNPLSINPLQPQLAETRPLTLKGSGPSSIGFNEYNPLFARDRFSLQASGVAGDNSTFGEDVTLSGLMDRISFSLGQFHYEDDGFRENNDITQDIYSVFAQTRLSPEFSMQAEYRYKETESGDLRLSFDPDNYYPDQRNDERIKSFRLGFNYSPSSSDKVLLSLIYNDAESKLSDRFEIVDPFFQLLEERETNAISDVYSGEVQYLRVSQAFNFVLGAGHLDQDRTDDLNVVSTTTIPPLPPNIIESSSSVDQDMKHTNGYLYFNYKGPANLSFTLGGAFDSFEKQTFEDDKFSPKIGVTWAPIDVVTLRAAWFRAVRRPFNANQTIEPTQVAGFNQFFDDLDGAKSERYGVGLDAKFSANSYAGIEASWREVNSPEYDELSGTTTIEKEDEELHRAYFYWMPIKSVSFGTESFFEKVERPVSSPNELTTYRTPVSISYFAEDGPFIKILSTYIDQKIVDAGTTQRDHFWITDLFLGYRLPKRWGKLTFGVKNLFNQSFNYQDANYNSGEAIIPIFRPERLVFCSVSISI